MKNLQEILASHLEWLANPENGERADLSEANLSEADLIGANLIGANLSEADLRGAVLIGANLRWAVLRGAVLRGAVLSEADLRGADLRGAVLSGADLRGAVLSEADLSGADLSEADLSEADLRWAIGLPEVQPFPLDAAVADACSAPNAHWNTCKTTHFRAGLAVAIHPQGLELEEKYGTNVAAALIYNACTGHVPDFYASNDEAMEDILKRAKK